MMTEREIADISKALSVPTRLKILGVLGKRSLCVNAITSLLEISQPAVSQHLAVLRKAGLVEGRKAGYMVHYTLNGERFRDYQASIAEYIGEDIGREEPP